MKAMAHEHMGHDHHATTAPNERAIEEDHDHSVAHLNHASVAGDEKSTFRLAVMATLHCLVGCGIGEIVGVIIGTALGLGMWPTMALAMSLGFVFGLGFGIIPLLRGGFGFRQALRIVLVSEGLSILVMESAEAAAQIFTPGVMQAGLSEPLFWYGMLIALAAGFIAALPVNIVLIRRGIRHHH